MNQANLDQYAKLEAKKTLSQEEMAVRNAIDGLREAEKPGVTPAALAAATELLREAEAALVITPSTTI